MTGVPHRCDWCVTSQGGLQPEVQKKGQPGFGTGLLCMGSMSSCMTGVCVRAHGIMQVGVQAPFKPNNRCLNEGNMPLQSYHGLSAGPTAYAQHSHVH